MSNDLDICSVAFLRDLAARDDPQENPACACAAWAADRIEALEMESAQIEALEMESAALRQILGAIVELVEQLPDAGFMGIA
jgi:hypothetical protein